MSDLSVMYRDRVRKSFNRYSAYERYNALYYVEEKEMSFISLRTSRCNEGLSPITCP